MENLKETHRDEDYIHYETSYNGKRLRISVCRSTGEEFFNAEDTANCMGYESVEAMIEDYKRITQAPKPALFNFQKGEA